MNATRLNLARRHLSPHAWGLAFAKLLEAKGVKRGSGKGNPKAKEHKAATVAALAKETGVSERTARHRLAQADVYESLPKELKKEVDAKEKTVVQAQRAVKEQRQESKRAENRKMVKVVMLP